MSCWSRRRALAAAGAALFAGCSVTGPSAGTPTTGWTPAGSFTPREWAAPTDVPTRSVAENVLVENLEVPWDVSVAPNGDLFVTERVGRVNRFSSGDVEAVLSPEDAIDAGSVEPGSDERPWWVPGGEGGTMGVAVDPRYPDPSYVYVHFTARFEGGQQENRVVRYDAGADDPQATAEPVLTGIPLRDTDAFIHRGGRLTFGPEGYLWATTGDGGFGYAPENDRTGGYRARDPSSMAGSLLRFTRDGEGAPGNPDLGPDADPRIVTYGHRNPQGLDWLPGGTPVAVEHGDAHDEVNLVVPGDDYGWPQVYTAEEHRANPGVHRPLVNTGWGRTASGERQPTTWAPSGCTFYTGDVVPGWRHRLLVGGLISQQVIAVTLNRPGEERPPLGEAGVRFDAGWLDNDRYVATAHPLLRDVLGRVRHVAQGPDGALYAITSNRDGRAQGEFPRQRDDVLVRLDPA